MVYVVIICGSDNFSGSYDLLNSTRSDSDNLLNSTRSDSDNFVTSARSDSDNFVTSARSDSDSLVNTRDIILYLNFGNPNSLWYRTN